MGQISIILLAGMLFLLNFEQPETDIALGTAQRLLWTLALTVAPAFLAYCVTVFASRVLPAAAEENRPKLHTLKRFMIAFECLSLVAYLGNLYLLNLTPIAADVPSPLPVFGQPLSAESAGTH